MAKANTKLSLEHRKNIGKGIKKVWEYKLYNLKRKIDEKGRFEREFPIEERKCLKCGVIFKVPSYSKKKHCSRTCANQRQGRGFESPFWKGGRAFKSNRGYVRIYVPGTRWKYELEHRYLMEKFLGRKLLRNEEVHHRNGIKDDNRFENLELVQRKNHFGKVTCPHCCKEFLIK